MISEKELQRESLGRQRRAFPVLVAMLVLHGAERAVRAELAVLSWPCRAGRAEPVGRGA